ncbi:hypothetical protein NPIL_61091 [Nephila pilipes]|uniref:Uncharacterized protein n=1 Tax=Nephila pilipes TaxID=299642 RepID=A0A8X6NP98_NEPPI|nr:hypothetical protein NPIL_61091 [Nephila pilipes]
MSWLKRVISPALLYLHQRYSVCVRHGIFYLFADDLTSSVEIYFHLRREMALEKTKSASEHEEAYQSPGDGLFSGDVGSTTRNGSRLVGPNEHSLYVHAHLRDVMAEKTSAFRLAVAEQPGCHCFFEMLHGLKRLANQKNSKTNQRRAQRKTTFYNGGTAATRDGLNLPKLLDES